ncbi:ornithine cyclodeaminase family protein [Flavilitoribacter nigricans]|uniref:ornithine cyclodeaminase family protein n=1 Tax=Flavilitoribacter nigricans TaxID=70997 RepID=UPI001F3E3AAC|nr:ornithine cyclodeaminase family protein [Flavilitoribacter nigricans]
MYLYAFPNQKCCRRSTVNEPISISADFIDRHHRYAELIELLRRAFAESAVTIPDRLHYDFGSTAEKLNSTLLVMPAWQNGQDLGIKLVTINPENSAQDLPAIQGSYLLMDARTGVIRAMIEGTSLTRKRTAATSALAASYLADPAADSLLMIGTGALAPELIAAHASVRPIRRVYLWGRRPARARELARELTNDQYEVRPVEKIDSVIREVAVISTATLSAEPLVCGADLQPGQHLDLVGAYKPDMRESDDEAVRKAAIFVDTYTGAIQESGDLHIPLQKGVIQRDQVLAELSELCAGKHPGRSSAAEITLFKSVGYALEDLVAARYYHQKWDTLKPGEPKIGR